MKRPTTSPSQHDRVPPDEQAPAHLIDSATLDLLARWRAEDAVDDPEQIDAAQQELDEFKRAMNETRRSTGEPLLFP